MWIDGKLVDAESGKTYPVYNPATEEKITDLPEGGIADVNKAVAAAKKAWPAWKKLTQLERNKYIMQIAHAADPYAQEIGQLDIMDHGTPSFMAAGMNGGLGNYFEYAAQVCRVLLDEHIPTKTGAFNYLQREPLGVCAIIVPWNAPLAMVTTKLSAALACGNTCVIKPPSICSITTLKYAEILSKLDLPAGVINVITGPGGLVGEALASHPDVDMISFTGSSETGQAIMAAAAKTTKRVSLELGGKNPFILLEDADVDFAVRKATFATIMNSGQVCASPGRYYVPENLHDEFVEKLIAGLKKIVVGDPTDKKTQMGPLVSAEHRAKVEGYIKIGKEEGATCILGGERPTQPPLNKGYYAMPTVFTNVKQNMRIAREEIFGPVAVILKYDPQKDDVVALANDTYFGLGASIWTRNIARGIKMASDIRAGGVWINDHMVIGTELPWGGFRQSGFGKENGVLGIEEYTQVKWISFDLTEGKRPF